MTELEAFAIDLARAASAATLPYFRGDHGSTDKGADRIDPVTRADREAEAAMRQLIAERYPEHGVVGEEYGEDRPGAEHVWVLDPVDGTRAFVAGLPLWTTLIGLKVQGQPRIGVISQPYLGELFIGSPLGARLLARGTERALKTRPVSALTEATIATTSPDIFTGAELGAWTQVRATARLTRYGCDAYAYAMLAAGHIDLVAESGLKPWDYTALIPIVVGASGAVSNWRGEPVDGSGQILAVGDERIRPQALVTLKRAALSLDREYTT
ncbi:MAG: histidinol-phosphatase [Brevundimonas sp.]|nr:MAG: histidinol-phosphatase [Brevundimonas sp.]